MTESGDIIYENPLDGYIPPDNFADEFVARAHKYPSTWIAGLSQSESDRQLLQEQLDRLGGKNNQQSEKQLLIDSIMNKTNSKSEKQRLVNDVKNKLRRLKNDQ